MRETHRRTLTKTVLYRLLSVIAIFVLSLAFGASGSTAGVLGLGAVVFGTLAYYVHDRVWLRFAWLTHGDQETKSRSLIKSVTYRIVVLFIAFGLAKVFLTASTETALLFTVIQMVINFALYYLVERVFNFISWGKTY